MVSNTSNGVIYLYQFCSYLSFETVAQAGIWNGVSTTFKLMVLVGVQVPHFLGSVGAGYAVASCFIFELLGEDAA